ncbi:MAG: sugar phosphate isomerase/epimerase [Candidatus Symbiothrix sp.]|jgi:D-psicose/D-tagatose/L-ribulose 3-epimerase|nr:sugar phosphate isomerase/epimerase [Candidatus Symbiothrix sp.]
MIQAKLGATTLSWICPPWNAEEGHYAIRQTAEAGFDFIEITLPHTMNFDASTVRKQLKENGLDVVCGLNLSAEFHIPLYPQKALNLIKAALDKCRDLESPYLGGVLHSGCGIFSGKQRTGDEENILFDVWGEAGHYAGQYGITIGIEPVNRYESYICTGAEEALDLIHRSGAANLALHLDTFHMNMEEQSFYYPVIKAGNRLQHIHIVENDRGLLGEGLVNWNDLFRALNDINFSGRLALENTSGSIPRMAATVALWRPSKHSAKEVATGSLQFMKQKITEFSK